MIRFLVVSLLLSSPLLAQTASTSISTDHIDPIAAGAQITFVVNASNEGPSDAADAQLTFTLPAEATFVSLSAPAGWSCTTGATVVCSTAALAPGTAAFTIVASTDPALAPQTIHATAALTSSTADPDSEDNTADIAVVITEELDVAVAINGAPDPVAAGDDITYTIDVTNNGPSAGDVTLTITPAAPLTQVSLSGPAGWSCGTWTCTAIDMMPGTEMLTLVAHVDPSATGSLTTDAHVEANDSITPNNDASDTAQIIVDTDVTVTKSSSAVTASGNSWTITVTASGPSSAQDVTLSDTLAPGASFGSMSAPAGWTCNTTTCTTPLLLPSSPAVFQLDTTGIAVTNTASVSSPTDNDTSNNTAVATTSADLAVVITNLSTVTASNNGPDNAVNASITFTMTGSITAPAGWTCVASTCTTPFFVVGSAVFTVTSTAVTITSAAPDPNLANNTDALVGAHVTGTKSSSGTQNPGAAVTFTITLTNDGPTAQNDVPGDELTDVLPSGLTLVSATATSGAALANTATNTVTWNGAIATGTSVTITIHATVKDDASGVLSNQATFLYDSDGDGTNDTTGTTNAAALAQNTAIPALSPFGLALLCALLGLVAMGRTFMR